MAKKSRQDRVQDHMQLVSDTLIKQIETGTAPWQRPWKPGERPLAHNLLTKNDYQGCNQMWLMMVSAAEDFTDTRWGTYRQIKEAGGQVRRGEKGYQVMAIFEVGQKEREQAEQEARDRGEDPPRLSRRMMPRVYTVFNAVQADGLPSLETEAPSWNPCERAEKILQMSGISIKNGGERACYNLTKDTIYLPHKSRFTSPEAYYATALHELAHATGHPNRMNRELLTFREDTDAYAREELRAEISALMVCTQLGLGYDSQNGCAYVKHWVSILKNTPEEIRIATTDAHKMSSYLLRGMGRESQIPDLSWTGASLESAEVPKPQVSNKSGKDTQSLPNVTGSMQSWTGLSAEEQMARNGWGADGAMYMSQPEWVCFIKGPERSTIPGIDFAVKSLIGTTDKLRGNNPEEVARAFIAGVKYRNPKVDFSGYTIRIQATGQKMNGASHEFPISDLLSLQRGLGSQTDLSHHGVEMDR